MVPEMEAVAACFLLVLRVVREDSLYRIAVNQGENLVDRSDAATVRNAGRAAFREAGLVKDVRYPGIETDQQFSPDDVFAESRFFRSRQVDVGAAAGEESGREGDRKRDRECG